MYSIHLEFEVMKLTFTQGPKTKLSGSFHPGKSSDVLASKSCDENKLLYFSA